MIHSITVANEFIELSKKNGNLLTNMQIQKLVYFAHIIYAVRNDGDRLIDEDWFAWTFGPVEKRLYESLRAYGRSPVSEKIPFKKEIVDEKSMKCIKDIYDTYGNVSAYDLSVLTHVKGGPWYKTWMGDGKFQVVPQELMYQFYAEKLKSK